MGKSLEEEKSRKNIRSRKQYWLWLWMVHGPVWKGGPRKRTSEVYEIWMKVESAVSFLRDLLVEAIKEIWDVTVAIRRRGKEVGNGNTMAPNWWALPWELTKQQRRIFPKICSLNPSDTVRFFLQCQDMLPISLL